MAELTLHHKTRNSVRANEIRDHVDPLRRVKLNEIGLAAILASAMDVVYVENWRVIEAIS